MTSSRCRARCLWPATTRTRSRWPTCATRACSVWLPTLRVACRGSTLTEAWTAILSRSGVQVQAAQSASQISQGVAEDAEARRASRSGVNLDEEAARLIQYQQSYQAAAKVLQVAQSVFDTLLQTADR